MNKQTKDVFFKLSTKIDESNHKIEVLADICTRNNNELDERIDKKADKSEMDVLVIEIEKLIGLFQAFERVIHQGVKH